MHAYLYLCWHSLFDSAILISISHDMFVFFANIPLNGASVSVHLVTVKYVTSGLDKYSLSFDNHEVWPCKKSVGPCPFFFFSGGGGEGCCLPESFFFKGKIAHWPPSGSQHWMLASKKNLSERKLADSASRGLKMWS